MHDFDDPDDGSTIFDALDAVARDHQVELGVAPNLPSRFDAHHHSGRRSTTAPAASPKSSRCS